MSTAQKPRKAAVVERLHQAGVMHLETHQEANGDDPDWAIWYAGYLLENGFDTLLGAKLLKSDLIYLLVLVDKQQKLKAPGAHWETYYADFFLKRYPLE